MAGYRGVYEPAALVRHFVPRERLGPRYFRRWLYQNGRDVARLERAYPTAVPLPVRRAALSLAQAADRVGGRTCGRFAATTRGGSLHAPHPLVRRLPAGIWFGAGHRSRGPGADGGPSRSPLHPQRVAVWNLMTGTATRYVLLAVNVGARLCPDAVHRPSSRDRRVRPLDARRVDDRVLSAARSRLRQRPRASRRRRRRARRRRAASTGC